MPAAAAVAFLAILTFGCSTQSDGPLQAPLEATVTPCVQYPGSDVDPCEHLATWRLTRAHYDWLDELIPAFPFDTYNDLKKWDASSWCRRGVCPLFFVRATVVPGSIRCGKIYALLFLDDAKVNIEKYPADDSTNMWSCYVDVVVKEYINGTGPQRLELHLTNYWQDPETESDERMRTLAQGSYGVGLTEGREFIIPLGRPYNLAMAAWHWLHIPTLDVQRTDDGEVVVVTHWARTPVRGLQDFTMSLTDFRETTRDAMERYYRYTDGRIGTSETHPIAPMNASKEGLLSFLRDLGGFSVDGVAPVTPVPPLDHTTPTRQE